MKKRIFFFCMFVTAAAQAQTFKPFKVNASLGLASARLNDNSLGIALSMEPKYGINDHLDLGLRLETAVIATPIYVNGNYSQKTDGKALNSGVVTLTYLFTTGAVRPFIGLGAGIYGVYGTTITIPNDPNQTPSRGEIGSEARFGSMLRAGLKIGHFTATAEYNGVPNAQAALSQTTVEQRNKYVSLKVGFDFGGGRR